MGRVKKIQFNLKKHIREHPAQSFVEFALALPILLLLMFGIIEFGRLMQAWLALENGARFAVRYAVTGQYDISYCKAAGDALGYAEQDYDPKGVGDGYDCEVPEEYPEEHPHEGQPIEDSEMKTIELQDWARLPSIRDNALGGASGIAWDAEESISGDYLQYMTDGFDETVQGSLRQDNRGNPAEPGYFNITTCSNQRVNLETETENREDIYMLNSNGFWYDDVHVDENLFPWYCQLADTTNTGDVLRYVDDAGGPGDRVRVILTYRHTLITPFISNWWPTLRLTTQREGLVEKFRTSRVTGLQGGIAIASTLTYTPSLTFTPSETLVPSLTPSYTETQTYTPSNTPTITPTMKLCGTPEGILRQVWYNLDRSYGNDLQMLLIDHRYPFYPDGEDISTSFTGPII